MLMWVAREKSPIGSEEAMTPVCYLPQGEKKVPPGALILPAEQAGVLVMSGRMAHRRRMARTEERNPHHDYD
jgi:hypothetical protein